MVFNYFGMSSMLIDVSSKSLTMCLNDFSQSFVNLSGASISHQPQYDGSLRGGGIFARPNFGGILTF